MTVLRLAGIAAGSAVSAGLAVVTATVLTVRTLQSPATDPGNPGALFYLLTLGTAGGILVAGAIAWTLLGPVDSTYRRGSLAIVSAFATIPLMLVSWPVEGLLGRGGLVGLLVVCAGLALWLWRQARHAVITWPTG